VHIWHNFAKLLVDLLADQKDGSTARKTISLGRSLVVVTMGFTFYWVNKGIDIPWWWPFVVLSELAYIYGRQNIITQLNMDTSIKISDDENPGPH
jgi:hypothetical protein